MAEDGWRREALYQRKLRTDEASAMNALADLIEEWIAGTCSEELVLLAFHYVAMAHGAFARKKTLRRALKSSILELSQRAPAIFPPDRVVRLESDHARSKVKMRVRKAAAVPDAKDALSSRRPAP